MTKTPRGEAVANTYKRRHSEQTPNPGKKSAKKQAKKVASKRKKKPAKKPVKRKSKKPTAFRTQMKAISTVINGAIGNLVGELEQLNAGKDVATATEIVGRGATLCVVAQVFDVLQAVIGDQNVNDLAKISKVVKEQRAVELASQGASGGCTKSAAGKQPGTLNRSKLAGLIKDVYGVSFATDVDPSDIEGAGSEPPAPSDGPMLENAEAVENATNGEVGL